MPANRLKQIVTALNPRQYADVLAYCKKHGRSLYSLLKEALFDYIKRHP